jgi:hypothetical protein
MSDGQFVWRYGRVAALRLEHIDESPRGASRSLKD